MGSLVHSPFRTGTPHMLFTGMSIGFADTGDPMNRFVATRAPLEEYATFHGL